MREEGGEEREGEGIGWEIARMRKREKRRGQREGLREGETGTDRQTKRKKKEKKAKLSDKEGNDKIDTNTEYALHLYES